MAPEHDPRQAGEDSPAAVPPGVTPPATESLPLTGQDAAEPAPAARQDAAARDATTPLPTTSAESSAPPPAAPSYAPPPPFAPGAPAGAQATAPVARQRGFRGWRRRRPFWGGLCVLIGGCEILLSERANISVVLHAGAESLAGYLLPGVIAVCGLLLLFNPMHRMFYSVIAVLCSLGTWITSNLGGFLVGMLLGLVGSSLAFGWLPDQEPRRWRRGKTGAARA